MLEELKNMDFLSRSMIIFFMICIVIAIIGICYYSIINRLGILIFGVAALIAISITTSALIEWLIT